MIKLALCAALAFSGAQTALGASPPEKGVASWYGEGHRGKLMANGKKFNPDRLTAASWFYPLGTRVKVTLHSPSANSRQAKSVYVTITDRGPAHDLVREGRIIDLAEAAFAKIADTDLGLVRVVIQPVGKTRARAASYTQQVQTVAYKKAA